MDCTIISATKDNQIKVERTFENVVVDRYLTDDLAKPPKRTEPWMLPVLEIGENSMLDPSPDIPVPPCPTPVGNIFERYEHLQADMKQACETVELLKRNVKDRERTIDTLHQARLTDSKRIEELQKDYCNARTDLRTERAYNTMLRLDLEYVNRPWYVKLAHWFNRHFTAQGA